MEAALGSFKYRSSEGIDFKNPWARYIVPLLILMAVIIYGIHAVEKHGQDAILVRQCMENDGPVQIWVMPDGRVENICRMNDGRWGIMVTDGFHEVTSFIKNKMTRLSQIEQYLRNLGGMKVTP
jgi:hypothetical protein